MNDKLKNIIAGGVAGLLLGGGGALGVGALQDDSVALLPEDFNIEDYINVEDLVGENGLRGPVGAAGPGGNDGADGMDGEDGADGIDGKSFSFDLGELTDAVVDEIEDREDRVTFAFSGNSGNYSFEFEADSDNYKFEIKHFGSGDFDVSIEDEDGNVTTLVDIDGHVSYTDTRSLSDGEYTIRVSADGNWSVEITEA